MQYSAYDARDLQYKSVFGALAQDQPAQLRICLPRELHCTGAYLSFRADGSDQRCLLPMKWGGMRGESHEWWEFTWSLKEPGLYWYTFAYDAGGQLRPITRGQRGRGMLNEGGGAWQLTVYDKSYDTPRWPRGGVMYQIFPDRFYKSGKNAQPLPAERFVQEDWYAPPAHQPGETGRVINNDYYGGDLKGIEEKLPYLASLGVTCLYLNPIVEAHSNHRYNTADYLEVDPALGTKEDFRRLCEKAATAGIRIILDGVFSHTGSDSVYFNREGRYHSVGAYQSKDSPYYPWYSFLSWPDEYHAWWGHETLPEVKEEQPGFLAFITGEKGVLRHWLELGAAGWRLDVADELPDLFLEKLRESVKGCKGDGLILGEVWEDASNKISYSRRRKYLLGKQLDSAMNYPFYNMILAFLGGGSGEDFADGILGILENYPPPAAAVMMNLLGTHDTARILTLLGGEPQEGRNRDWQAVQHMTPQQLEAGKQKLRLASLLQYTLPGIPCLYYGDEAGMEGYTDPFNRGGYPWGREDTALLEWYRALGRLRGMCPAFDSGEWRLAGAGDAYIAYERRRGEDRVLIGVNRGGESAALPLNEAWKSVAGFEAGQEAENGLTLPPMTGVVRGLGPWAER